MNETKHKLSNDKFYQPSGDTLNLSGHTKIFGAIEYDADYSSHYNDRSLVDKAFVLANATTGSSGGVTVSKFNAYTGTTAPATFVNKLDFNSYTGTTIIDGSNGLHVDDNHLKLGGIITDYTTININDVNLQIIATGSSSFINLENVFSFFGEGSEITTSVSVGSSSLNLVCVDNFNGKSSNININQNVSIETSDNTTDESIQFTLDMDDGAIFNDSRTVKKGIEYGSNYSADFTDRSLIDKGYLQSQISGLTSGDVSTTLFNTYTGSTNTRITKIETGYITGATNGLKIVNKRVSLGGALTSNTTISGSSRNLTLDINAFTHGTRAAGTIGSNSFTSGGNNVASNQYAHAEGDHTQATSYATHAEGYYTQATAYAAHAEGYNTQATDSYSHAEGNATQANGESSHAEGYNTQANGDYSHSGGYGDTSKNIIALGISSFNHSYNNSSQTTGHGALAQGSAILGGLNHNIPSGSTYSAILGGTNIKVGSAITNTVHFPKIRFGLGTGGSVVSGSTSDQMLVRNNSTGEIEIRTYVSGGTGGSGVSLSVFNTYTGATKTTLDSKLASSIFDSYIASITPVITSKLYTSTFNTYTGATQTALNDKLSKTPLIKSVGSSYSITSADNQYILEVTGSTNSTLTFASGATTYAVTINNLMAANTVTLAAAAGTTLQLNGSVLTYQYDGASIYVNNNKIRGFGNLA